MILPVAGPDRADEMRFALLEHAPDGVIVVDATGLIVYANGCGSSAA
jgi:PAS domain-containing protein